MSRGRRPTEAAARHAIRTFLREAELEGAMDAETFSMFPNGDDRSAPQKMGWGFYILPDDTSSYVHEDLSIEWYGTGFDGPVR